MKRVQISITAKQLHTRKGYKSFKGLHYIHDQVRLHTDIKAGNILIDTDKGSIKLADYGISVPIYDSSSIVEGSSSLSSSLRMKLIDVAGTPYWVAPEVLHFLVQVIVSGLIYGLLQKKDFKNKNFSKGFKDLVASCLDQDPSKRPPAYQLLEEEEEERLPPQRLRLIKGSVAGNLIEDGFVLDPLFHTGSEDDQVVKMVRFGGETIIPNLNIEFIKSSGGSGDLEGSVGDHNGANTSGIQEIIEDLVALKKCLDEQRKRVVSFSVWLGGEAAVEEQMMQRIENLMDELNLEKENKLKKKIDAVLLCFQAISYRLCKTEIVENSALAFPDPVQDMEAKDGRNCKEVME
ncbi:hypothetical protein SADUNF_Sadunf13G0105600 [Salix dunnii]|uniref:Protein kinase domain-containing protein n=1 Tax=Salix dunnii TaxID=1413687 RepID=A0A835MLA6_9ROSI|nr:hypothetical protein SADUNF_Sadunf13G0105600 [Salix dunnii]